MKRKVFTLTIISFVVAVAVLTCTLLLVSSMDGAQFIGPEGSLIEAFAYEDGSSLIVMASLRNDTDYHIYVIFLYPDGSTMTNWFVVPQDTDLESITVKHCRTNVQVFGQAKRPWRYVWVLPFNISEILLPLVCQ